MLKSPFAFNQDEMDMMAVPQDPMDPGPGGLPDEGQPGPPGPVPSEWDFTSPWRPRHRTLPPTEDPPLPEDSPLPEDLDPDASIPDPVPLPAPPNTPTGVGGTFQSPADFSAHMTAGGGPPPGTSAYGPGAPLAPAGDQMSDEELLKGITRRR